MAEIAFAAVGLQVRLDTMKGQIQTSGKTLLEKEIQDKEWLSRLMEETGKMAVRYPVYLKGRFAGCGAYCQKFRNFIEGDAPLETENNKRSQMLWEN